MGGSESTNPFQCGFRIYHLIKDGPLDKIGCKSLSDFIIPPTDIIKKKINFIDYLKINAGKEINLTIFSLLKRQSKIISIKCNEKNSKDGMIGASVNFENFTNAHKNVLHIIKVKDYSFASVELKLKEKEDYIIAVKPKEHEIISLNQEGSDPLTVLGNIVQANKGNECEFFIFNVKNGARSVVTKIGTDSDFVVGIEGAYGALHEFPFEESEDDNNNDNNNVSSNNDINENKKEEIIDKNNENNLLNNNINNSNNINNNINNNNKKEENVNDLFKTEEKKQEENNIFD